MPAARLRWLTGSALWRINTHLSWIFCCLAAIFGLMNGMGALLFRGPSYTAFLIMIGSLLPVPLLAIFGRGAYRYATGRRVARRGPLRPLLNLLDLLLRETSFWLIAATTSLLLASWLSLFGLWQAFSNIPLTLAPGFFLFSMGWCAGSAALATICHLLGCGPLQAPAALQRYMRQ